MIPATVATILAAHGLQALEFEPGSTPTVASAARRIGVDNAQIAKSLVFRDKVGNFHMVVCAGDVKVSSGKLKRLVGSDVSMASADETFAATGFKPGGVCPFGVSIPIYIDESLRDLGTIYPAAGNDATGVPTHFEQLVQICDAQICDVCNPISSELTAGLPKQ